MCVEAFWVLFRISYQDLYLSLPDFINTMAVGSYLAWHF